MMNYEEKYGERVLSDEQEREEQDRIDKEERLEQLELCVGRLKDLINSANENSLEDLKDLLSEMKYEISCLE